jgi:hypothetical protein
MQSDYTPNQRKRLDAIREEKSVLRAEISVSIGLRTAEWKKLRKIEKATDLKTSELDKKYDALIRALEKERDKRMEEMHGPEKTQFTVYKEHDSDVDKMRARIKKLSEKEDKIRRGKIKYCEHCGQEK